MEITVFHEQTRAYINHVTVALLIVIYHLLSCYVSVDHDSETLAETISTYCDRIEDRFNQTVNLIETVSENASADVSNLLKTLSDKIIDVLADLCLFAGKAIVYLIDTYKSTLQCFIKAFLDSSVFIIKTYSQNVQNAIQATVDGARSAADQVVKGATDAANSVASFFVGNRPIQDVVIPQVTLPFDLQAITSGIPDNLAQTLSDDLTGIILRPFQIAADSLRNVKNSMNVTIDVRLPSMNVKIPELCKNELLQNEITAASNVIKWALMILIVISLVAIVVNACLHVFLARKQQQLRKSIVKEGLKGVTLGQTYNEIAYDLTYPVSAFISSRIAGPRRMRLKWFLQYIIYGPSILCALIGITGMTISIMQIGAITQIEGKLTLRIIEAQTKVLDLIRPFENETNARITTFIQQVNVAIGKTEKQINEKTLKPMNDFIRDANQTSNMLIDKTKDFMDNTLNLKIFGPFFDDLFKCVVVNRVQTAFRLLDILKVFEVQIPRLNRNLFEKRMLKFNAGVDSIFQGLSRKLLRHFARWKTRAKQHFYIAIATLCFSFLIVLQGLLFALTSLAPVGPEELDRRKSTASNLQIIQAKE